MRITPLSNHRSDGRKVLLIYTGGTFGMQLNHSGTLIPLSLTYLAEYVPDILKFSFDIDLYEWEEPIDSANINPEHWNNLAKEIYSQYNAYEGFVVLHGTDTMAFTSSALSFLLEGLDKPVVFTGAQLPLGEVRSDARENLLTALQIASEGIVREVCLYFHDFLYRGNCVKKVRSAQFRGFDSPNLPAIAKVGISIEYNHEFLRKEKIGDFKLKELTHADEVLTLKIHPGIGESIFTIVCNNIKPKVLLLEAYGSGTAPTDLWFVDFLQTFIENGGIVIILSQCLEANVALGKYATSKHLKDLGVLESGTMTYETVFTKTLFLLKNYAKEDFKRRFSEAFCGEIHN